MFTNFFRAALFGFVQRWMSTPTNEHDQPPIHLNMEELKAASIHFTTFAVLAFLNFQLFVGAVIVTTVAVAHSFDVYDHFVSSSVFWAGLIMGFTALLVGGICSWLMVRRKFPLRNFVVTESYPEQSFDIRNRIIKPFYEGLMEGLRKERGTVEQLERSA